MFKWKKMLISLLSVSVIAATPATTALATQPGNAYTYKVTLSAGNKGSISGQEKIEVQDLNAGDDVSFDLSQIQVTDEKYYVKVSVSAVVTMQKLWRHRHLTWTVMQIMS
mgnify:CR=1 FL=1